MGERTTYAPGTFCWVDLATSDGEAAVAFYSRLFGWEPRRAETYTMLFLGGTDVAALYQSQEPAPPHWTSYVAVEDADATAARVADLGGQLVAEPFDVFDEGRMAVVRDPVDAVFALWQPRNHPGAGLVNVVNAWCWNDLVTPEPARVEPFYRELLGWEIARLAPEYGAITNRGAKNGGIFTAPEGSPSYWLPYFAVADVDATVAAVGSGGGKVIAPPFAVPAGRFAVVGDPQGAAFGLLQGELDP